MIFKIENVSDRISFPTKGPGNIYRRHGTGANGHGTLIFFNVAYPWDKHFFYKGDAHGTNNFFDALFSG